MEELEENAPEVIAEEEKRREMRDNRLAARDDGGVKNIL